MQTVQTVQEPRHASGGHLIPAAPAEPARVKTTGRDLAPYPPDAPVDKASHGARGEPSFRAPDHARKSTPEGWLASPGHEASLVTVRQEEGAGRARLMEGRKREGRKKQLLISHSASSPRDPRRGGPVSDAGCAELERVAIAGFGGGGRKGVHGARFPALDTRIWPLSIAQTKKRPRGGSSEASPTRHPARARAGR